MEDFILGLMDDDGTYITRALGETDPWTICWR